MNPAEQRAEQLAVLEAVERSRDMHLLAAAADDRTARRLRGILAATAVTMPPLAEPERPEWVSVGQAARLLGVEKNTMAQRARRGVTAGIAEKRGGRWYVRLDRMPPAQRRAP